MSREQPGNPKRNRKEMHFEGDTDVLVNLFRKKSLLEKNNGEHTMIRPVLIAGPGGMKGVYAGGQVIALEKAGLSHVFDAGIGISTGGPAIAHLLSKQTEQGTSIYYEECTTKKFLSFSRILLGRRLMGTKFLVDVFRGKTGKKIDTEAIQRSRTEAAVVATHAQTGEKKFLDMKPGDVIENMHASLNMPGIGEGPITIDGEPYVDGTAYSLPVTDIVERYDPTDILILMNRSELKNLSSRFSEKFLLPLFMWAYPKHVREVFSQKNREALFRKELALARTQTNCRIAIIWTDNAIGSLTTDSRALRKAKDRSERHLTGLLSLAKSAA